MKTIMKYLGVGLLCSALTLGAYKFLGFDKKNVIIENSSVGTGLRFASARTAEDGPAFDFTLAAEISTPAVVHIKSTVVMQRQPMNRGRNPFYEFFGDDMFDNQQRGPHKSESAGSGVIITSDGYIVTNNHVVTGADEISITLNDNRTYTAKVIGTDPTTDLALIKIDATELPFLVFGNSDQVKVGEWVLAVGNPFNLASTVTAGIVSAKGRNIHILKENYAIESFIQTDAAVNPGNSGGALVNLRGELIGVNTAIATPTGTYAGYSFAVPSDIVKKVIEDLLKYGNVQRGLLGVTIRDVDAALAREADATVNFGVYVDSVLAESAAKEGGVKKGDIITKVDGVIVRNAALLQEVIGRHRPGESVVLTLHRKGKESEVKVRLKNKEGKTEIAKRLPEKSDLLTVLGAELEDIEAQELKKLGIENGVRVTRILDGKLAKQTDMKDGFIITKVEDKPVKSVKDLEKMLSDKKGGVKVEGIYPNFPSTYYYAFGM